MKIPPVSVGLPVFNGEAYLEDSLKSLLAQTFSDFELIISDNASTDRTQQICRDYAAGDSRIVYHRNSENLGVVANEKRVVDLARGEFFRFAASDDLCAPSHLSACFAVLSQNPEAVLVYPRIQLIDENGKPVEEYDEGLDLQEPQPHLRLEHLLNRINMCNASFGLFRLETFRKLDAIQNFPSYDVVYLANFSLYGKFIEIPETLFFRRIYLDEKSGRRMSIHQRTVVMNANLSGKLFFPYWALLKWFTRGIRKAPLETSERLRCLAALRIWIARYRRSLYWDLRVAASQMLTGERYINTPRSR